MLYIQKLNEEALAHASLKYNLELTNLSSANAKLTSSLDQETALKEKLESELASMKARMEATGGELDRAAQARSELERWVVQMSCHFNERHRKRITEISVSGSALSIPWWKISALLQLSQSRSIA